MHARDLPKLTMWANELTAIDMALSEIGRGAMSAGETLIPVELPNIKTSTIGILLDARMIVAALNARRDLLIEQLRAAGIDG